MKTQRENPNGLHRRYHIQKIKMIPNPDFAPNARVSQIINNHDQYIESLGPVDNNSEYFVLRLDKDGSDPDHIRACRIAVNAYADAIEHHIPGLAKDIRKKWPIKTALDETREFLLEVTRNLGHPAYEHSQHTHDEIDALRERAFDFLGIPKDENKQ